MKPIIGITVDAVHDPEDQRSHGKLQLNWNYAEAVTEAGGVPILIPPMADPEAVLQIIDGWVIPGGNDIDARHFGEENHPTVEPIDPNRFEGEQRLFRAADEELPVLGICYGCQFVNVMRGGSLIQHLPEVVGHESHTGGTLQTYEVDPESKLSMIVGDTKAEGKSYHHQAIARLGSKLEVVARGEDGTVEAIEATDRPWLVGVQWHPERTLNDHATRKLFEDFVAAAKLYAERRRQKVAAG